MSGHYDFKFDQPVIGISINPIGSAVLHEKQASAEEVLAAQVELQELVGKTLASIETNIEKIASVLDQLQPRLFDLSLNFSETLSRTIFQEDPEIVRARLHRYLDAGVNESSTHFSVWVHPDCVHEIKEYVADSQLKNVSVNADRHLAKGDCRIESPTDGIIARLESHIDAARNKILSELNSGVPC